jgi:hypothetical protein
MTNSKLEKLKKALNNKNLSSDMKAKIKASIDQIEAGKGGSYINVSGPTVKKGEVIIFPDSKNILNEYRVFKTDKMGVEIGPVTSHAPTLSMTWDSFNMQYVYGYKKKSAYGKWWYEHPITDKKIDDWKGALVKELAKPLSLATKNKLGKFAKNFILESPKKRGPKPKGLKAVLKDSGNVKEESKVDDILKSLKEKKATKKKAKPVVKDWKKIALKELEVNEGVALKIASYNEEENSFIAEEIDIKYGRGYVVAKNEDAGLDMAVERVRQDLEEEPYIFTKSFLERAIYNEDNFDDSGMTFLEYLNEVGADLNNHDDWRSFNIRIEDTRSSAMEAVRIDGIPHFLASYDHEQIDLPSGAVAYRHN